MRKVPEKRSILNVNKKICNKMNNYFINITKILNLKPYKCFNTMNISEIISTFDNHIIIKNIKAYFLDASNNNFEFTVVSEDILHLNIKTLSTGSSITAKILKQSIKIHLLFLTNSINYTIKNDEFPGKLKKKMLFLYIKRRIHQRRKTTDQSAYNHMHQRFLNKSCIKK